MYEIGSEKNPTAKMSRKAIKQMLKVEGEKSSAIARTPYDDDGGKAAKDLNGKKNVIQRCGTSRSDEIYEVKLKSEHNDSGKTIVDKKMTKSVTVWNNLHADEPKTPKPPSRVRFHDKVKVKNLYEWKEENQSNEWVQVTNRNKKNKKNNKRKSNFNNDYYYYDDDRETSKHPGF